MFNIFKREPRSVNFNMRMTRSVRDRITAMKVNGGLKSDAEVFRKALATLDFLERAVRERKGDIIIRFPDGTEENLDIS